jgi:low temperature requirement protein LtrA
MFDGAYMSSEVIGAVVQLLPLFLLAFIVAEGSSMARWKAKNLDPADQKVRRRAIIWFLAVVLLAFVIEVGFLFALNGGDAHGRDAFTLWGLAISWLAALFVAVLASSLPDLSNERKK